MNEFNKYINHVANIKIKHEAFEKGMKILEEAYELKQNGYQSPYVVAIIGESRVGKTTLINTFLEKHKIVETKTGRITGCVLITVPVKPNSSSLCEAILQGLGDFSAHKKDSESSKRFRVITLIKKLGVRLIILDEMQHFVGRWSSTVLHDAADSLKVIIDETCVMMVVAGLEYGRHLLHQNESFKGRVKRYIDLSRFDWEVRSSRMQFRGLLQAFQIEINPFELPDIRSEELAYRFYISSGGLMGYVINIIESAMHLAIVNKRFQITIEDLMEAHDVSTMESDRKFSNNPFNLRAESASIDALAVSAKHIGTAIEMDPPKRRTRTSKKNQLFGVL
ncbi:TniB family NTP-binding protein [Methylotenera sp.]|uniref:TniB family NTP-binding protein n=1 Tax=Methylotenera sp. TaxID=2051956 RepID=UPI002717574B|nr:TniB family NTP-binding protein [Methylotenera sp.]MDO9204066.1 TniB family NTP-binding protein [Methylotenera sp.]